MFYFCTYDRLNFSNATTAHYFLMYVHDSRCTTLIQKIDYHSELVVPFIIMILVKNVYCLTPSYPR